MIQRSKLHIPSLPLHFLLLIQASPGFFDSCEHVPQSYLLSHTLSELLTQYPVGYMHLLVLTHFPRLHSLCFLHASPAFLEFSSQTLQSRSLLHSISSFCSHTPVGNMHSFIHFPPLQSLCFVQASPAFLDLSSQYPGH